MDIAQGAYPLRACLLFTDKSVSIVVENVCSLQIARHAGSTRVLIFLPLAAAHVFSLLQPVRQVCVDRRAFHGYSSRYLWPVCTLVLHIEERVTYPVRHSGSTQVLIYLQLAASRVFSLLQPVSRICVETCALRGCSSRYLWPACLLVCHIDERITYCRKGLLSTTSKTQW